jgi:hypothetical protein
MTPITNAFEYGIKHGGFGFEDDGEMSESDEARRARWSDGMRLLYRKRRRLSSVQLGETERSSLAEEMGRSRLRLVLEGEGKIVTGIVRSLFFLAVKSFEFGGGVSFLKI